MTPATPGRWNPEQPVCAEQNEPLMSACRQKPSLVNGLQLQNPLCTRSERKAPAWLFQWCVTTRPECHPVPTDRKEATVTSALCLFYINLWYKGNKKLSYQRVTQTSRRVLKLINPQMCWAHATVWGEKVQVSKGEEIRCFEPLLHGQDYVAKVVTINQYVQSLKWLCLISTERW